MNCDKCKKLIDERVGWVKFDTTFSAIHSRIINQKYLIKLINTPISNTSKSERICSPCVSEMKKEIRKNG